MDARNRPPSGPGGPAPACSVCVQAARLAPRYDTPHDVLGLCHLAQGETEQAVAEFRALLALYRDRSRARHYKAQVAAHLARPR